MAMRLRARGGSVDEAEIEFAPELAAVDVFSEGWLIDAADLLAVPNPGPVVFVNEESGKAALWRRLDALSRPCRRP